MNCSKCGGEIRENDLFCENCGNSITEQIDKKCETKVVESNKYRKKRIIKQVIILMLSVVCIIISVSLFRLYEDAREYKSLYTKENLNAIQELGYDGEEYSRRMDELIELYSEVNPDRANEVTNSIAKIEELEELKKNIQDNRMILEKLFGELGYGMEDDWDEPHYNAIEELKSWRNVLINYYEDYFIVMEQEEYENGENLTELEKAESNFNKATERVRLSVDKEQIDLLRDSRVRTINLAKFCTPIVDSEKVAFLTEQFYIKKSIADKEISYLLGMLGTGLLAVVLLIVPLCMKRKRLPVS